MSLNNRNFTHTHTHLLLHKIYLCHFCVVSALRMTKMHPCRDRFLMNQMMHHGKNPLNLEFVNCMCLLFSFLRIFVCNIYLKYINFIASEKYSPNPAAAFSEVVVPDEVFLVFQRWLYLVAVPVIRLYNAFLKMRWVMR